MAMRQLCLLPFQVEDRTGYYGSNKDDQDHDDKDEWNQNSCEETKRSFQQLVLAPVKELASQTGLEINERMRKRGGGICVIHVRTNGFSV